MRTQNRLSIFCIIAPAIIVVATTINIVTHFQMDQQTDLLSPNGLRDILWVSGVDREQIRVLNPLCFIAVSIRV